jgi:hypothetical protein
MVASSSTTLVRNSAGSSVGEAVAACRRAESALFGEFGEFVGLEGAFLARRFLVLIVALTLPQKIGYGKKKFFRVAVSATMGVDKPSSKNVKVE